MVSIILLKRRCCFYYFELLMTRLMLDVCNLNFGHHLTMTELVKPPTYHFLGPNFVNTIRKSYQTFFHIPRSPYF